MEIVQTALTTPESDDGDLLFRARTGDERAFTSVYRRYADAIYRYALHMSGNAGLAEEVLQETFLALFRDGNGFDPVRGSLGAYIFGIARNRVRKVVSFNRGFSEPEEEIRAPESDVLADLTRRETIDAVRQAVLALPATYREAIVLCELDELSYEQAADVMGCPVGTVRSRLHRGRAMLLMKLQEMKRNRVLA